MNPLTYEYPSRRSLVYGKKGMVCTSQPLAAQAGLDMIKAGGNAVDAAIAAAAALTVLEPTSNGLGSDAFALVWMDGKLHGLNASGRYPRGLGAQEIRDMGYEEMPRRGWIPVMVPGAVSAWEELSHRFGRLPFETLMEPAASYAEEGYPVSPVVSQLWKEAYEQFVVEFQQECFRPWFEHFSPEHRAPRAGEIWKSPEMAKTLKLLGREGAKAFYQGELADSIDAFSRKTGGYIRKEDLADYWCQWVEPIHTNYRGYDVWEIPPNGMGIIVLMTLNLLSGFEFEEKHTAKTVHRQIECMKLAFADGKRYIADPKYMKAAPDQLLNMEYARTRRKLIGEKALDPESGDPFSGGTVYLSAADGEGGMVSFIQSNYMGFGSGIVIPGTGISLQNRGANFTLDPNRENCVAPGKKSFHTIIPGFLSKDGEPVGPFGVMGAFMQPQGQIQVLMNMIDFDLNPQAALDAPRWQWIRDKVVEVEPDFPEDLVDSLKERGHEVIRKENKLDFGRGQIIQRTSSGALVGATEPRADGIVAAW